MNDTKLQSDVEQGQPIGAIEAWHEPVGEEAITDAVNLLRKHLFISHDQAVTCVCWLASSMMFQAWDKSARLLITAPMKNCGKSTLLNALTAMADNAIEAGRSTAAAYTYYASQQNQTFFIDEADLIFKNPNSEMTVVLNTGYERGKPYLKTEVHGGNPVGVSLPVYSAAALAGIKLESKLADSTLDRCLVIRMQRAKKSQISDRYRPRKHEALFKEQGRRIKRWVLDNYEEIASQEVTWPDYVDSRIEDNWEAVMAIAMTHSSAAQWKVREFVLGENATKDMGGWELNVIKDLREWYCRHCNTLMDTWDKNISAKGIGPEAARQAIMELHAFDEKGERPWENFYPDRVGEAKHIQARDISKALSGFGIYKSSIRAGHSIWAFRWEDILSVYDQYVAEERSSVVDVVDLQEAC
jgi:hypothetical protein